MPASWRRRARRIARAVRHPARTIDTALWRHYSPDAAPLIQQLLDAGGGVVPPGKWKIEGPLRVPPGARLTGGRLKSLGIPPGGHLVDLSAPAPAAYLPPVAPAAHRVPEPASEHQRQADDDQDDAQDPQQVDAEHEPEHQGDNPQDDHF